ncbi:MAG TPA: haloacid dehalogenase type II, partial [Chloroflexota bacterium]|nr:haloacid dehalogenase type II [Chloroflexota bacterium]
MTGIDGHIRALLFDVFGTVVDWRSSVIAEGEALARAQGWPPDRVDWGAFADRWRREGYSDAIARIRRGEAPWALVDALHRAKLDELLAEHGLAGLAEAEVAHFNRVWHRLRPWPDAVPGLQRLRRRFVLAPLSNGNFALLTNMAKHAGLPWDCILSAELFGAYKPDPAVYRGALALLGIDAHEAMMVAAHPGDLRAARALGLRAAYVPRPHELGPGAPPPA